MRLKKCDYSDRDSDSKTSIDCWLYKYIPVVSISILTTVLIFCGAFSGFFPGNLSNNNLFTSIAAAEEASSESIPDGLRYFELNGGIFIAKYEGTETELVLPDSIDDLPVTAINSYAFSGCSKLESITIPASVTEIHSEAFLGCKNLKTIKISEKNASFCYIGSVLYSIDKKKLVFCLDYDSKEFSIPDNVTTIEKQAFVECSKLTKINVSDNNACFCSIDGVLFSKDKKTLFVYPRGQKNEYRIPAGVTSIGDGAFADCTGLTSVTIPDSVTSIGGTAFMNCTGLTSITIPDRVTSIGERAFADCSGLTSITFPDRVTKIDYGAFASCSGLTSITIPDSVTEIGSWAFARCTSLTKIEVSEKNADFCSIDGVLFSKDQKTLIAYPFSGKTEYRVPDSVTTIDNGAFQGNDKIKSLTISANVTAIKTGFLFGCNNLTVYAPIDSAAANEARTFGVNFRPRDISALDGETAAFLEKTKYSIINEQVVITKHKGTDKVVAIPAKIEGLPVVSVGAGAFSGCSELTSVTIPESVTSIGMGAFIGCKNLTSITIPDSVTEIGFGAFTNCKNLTIYAPVASAADLYSNSMKIKFVDSAAADSTSPDAAQIPYRLGYEIKNKRAIITQYTGNEKNLVIPASINGFPVRIISDSAFSNCNALTSITIPDSVTRIEADAFSSCKNLTSIIVDDKNSMFCSIDGVLFSKDKKALLAYPCKKSGKEYSIPADVIRVSDSAFSRSSVLTSITIPAGVNSDILDAFAYCFQLTSVTIYAREAGLAFKFGLERFSGDKLTIHAFAGGSLEEYVKESKIKFEALPETLATEKMTAIEEDPIAKAYGFHVKNNTIEISLYSGKEKDIVIPASIEGLPVTTIGGRAFDRTKITSVVIPDTVTSIKMCAFDNCANLLSVAIPDSVTEIEYGAFGSCESLTSVTIPGSIEKVYLCLFSDCTSLKTVKLLEGVKELEMDAFQNCSALTSITIPASVTKVSGTMQTKNRFTVYGYPGSAAEKYAQEKGYNFAPPKAVPIKAKKDLSESNPIPEKLEYRIDEDERVIITRYQGSEKNLVIPLTIKGLPVEIITREAFKDCTELTSVTIPDSVTMIGDSAFEGCTGLTSVTLPDSVTTLGSSAFSGCSNLTTVVLSKNVSSIETRTFALCSKLTSITIFEGVKTIGERAFKGCSGLTSITLPEGVTAIGTGAFSGCTSLTSITIPEGVTAIGTGTFSGCTGLTSITIPEGVTAIGTGAFSGCTGLTSITIPEGVTAIEADAFSGCTGLTSITIPEGVTAIEAGAFINCTSLTSITLPKSTTKIGERSFLHCNALTSITIPGNVTEIGEYAFIGCSTLKKIEVSEDHPKFCSIDGALYSKDKKRLLLYPGGGKEEYRVPEGVTSIAGYAFAGCPITSITIPNSVTINEPLFQRDNPNLTIHAPVGSSAEEYAKRAKIKVIVHPK